MCNFDETISNLKKKGFEANYFIDRKSAVEYIKSQLKNETIGFGGSVTLKELNLFDELKENNEVYWHWEQEVAEARKNSESADVYITSANAIASKCAGWRSHSRACASSAGVMRTDTRPFKITWA